MSKQIINKVTNCQTLDWKILQTFEFNTLKDNKERNVKKLTNSIINQGFSFPFHIWADHKYIIDGTGRFLALTQLEKQGYNIPLLPVVEIQADTLKQAKALVLSASSQHGQISQTSLGDFTSIDFELEELKILQAEIFEIRELDFMFETLESEGEENPKASEDADQNQLLCPHCGKIINSSPMTNPL